MERAGDNLEEILERLRREHTHPTTQSYNCQKCKDVGSVKVVINGIEYWRQCECIVQKTNKERIQNSGLTSLLREYTFEKYETNEPWQKAVKEKALEYAEQPYGWFFVGGISGSGKTHICTAICKELMSKHMQVRYMMWVEENTKLKANRNNDEEYNNLISVWKNARVLYIDDFFKTRKGANVTDADVMTAYEILNYRYMQQGQLTIISSELSVGEIMNIDAAVGGRIREKSHDFILNIGNDINRNLRWKRGVTHK